MNHDDHANWQREVQRRRRLARREQEVAEMLRHVGNFGQTTQVAPLFQGIVPTMEAQQSPLSPPNFAKLSEQIEAERRLAGLNTSVASGILQQQQQQHNTENEARLQRDLLTQAAQQLAQNQLLLDLRQQFSVPQLAQLGAAPSATASVPVYDGRKQRRIMLPPAGAATVRGTTTQNQDWGQAKLPEKKPEAVLRHWIGAERKASFPAPLVRGASGRTPRLKDNLLWFRGQWNQIETFSDRMDDTPKDQEVFVKELFLRSLYRRGSEESGRLQD